MFVFEGTTEMELALGLDVGGTNMYGILVDQTGRIVADLERPTPSGQGAEAILSAMKGVIRSLLDRAPAPVLGIGMGIPGVCDAEAGISRRSVNLGWENQPVAAPIRAEFGLPVVMDNDVRAGAYGELCLGAGRAFRHFLFAALGTGVGSGIVLDGQIYRGPFGSAGEFGHIPVRREAGLCKCGNEGCLELLCSGPAVRRRALEALQAGEEAERSLLRQIPADQLDARSLAEAARQGDRLALQVWEEVGTDLGWGILAYANLMGPEAVIIGGGVSLAGDLLLEPARRVLEHRLVPGVRGRLQVVAAELGDEAGALGAAAMVPGFRKLSD